MARISRKELKTDKFALEVGHTVEYVETHRGQIARYVAIAAVIVLVVVAVLAYLRQQRNARAEALAAAMRLYEAPLGPQQDPAIFSFASEEVKDTEIVKAFSGLKAKYPGSDVAVVADYILGSHAVDHGKLNDAEKYYKEAVAGGSSKYASLAKLALGQLYMATGRAAEGEKLLRSMMEKSDGFVSREEATIVYARTIGPTKPQEARKLLEALAAQQGNPAISRLAVAALGELNPQ